MATVRNGKTTGRLYTTDQTVEQDEREPKPQAGNKTGFDVASVYKNWVASYRGFTPHGIRLPSPQRGNLAQFDDNPDVFSDQEEEPLPNLVEIDPYDQTYWKAFTQNVTTQPIMICGYEMTRCKMRIINQGPGTVWIAHNESVLLSGFPIRTTDQPLELETTREVWAVQQAAQASPAQVSILQEYIREVGS